MKPLTQLQHGLTALTLDLSAEQQQQLLSYLNLIQKWSQHTNLTAIKDTHEIINKHLIDSLSILPLLNAKRILDVGSGAGLPGIPIAIARPDCHVTVCDSAKKKTLFMTQVKAELKLNNLEVVHTRIQEYEPEQPFDMILTRAFQQIADFYQSCSHLNHGDLLLMKGQYPHDELNAFDREAEVVSLNVPGLKRHAVIIKRNKT